MRNTEKGNGRELKGTIHRKDSISLTVRKRFQILSYLLLQSNVNLSGGCDDAE